jgi:hypothetical protein
LGGSGPKYVGSGLSGDLTLTLGCHASALFRAWRQGPPAHCPPGGVYRMGGKGGRRGGSTALPGSPPHSPAAGMMLPRSSLPPLPGLCFPPTQPTPVPRMSLDVNTPNSPPLVIALLLLRPLLLLLQLPWGVGICIGVRRRCRCHCHGGNLAVIVAASAAIVAAVGGGRACMIAS